MKNLVAGLSFLAALGAAGAADAPLDAAKAFYAVYAQHPADGLPGKARYTAVVTPALAALLDHARAADEAFRKANKAAPPLVEGDLFTSLFEGATATRVESCRTTGAHAACTVELTYDDPKKPLHWSDTVYLAETPKGWRVEDIGYGAPWPFANKGRLTQTLQQLAASAGG
jgi:hypothetical protein